DELHKFSDILSRKERWLVLNKVDLLPEEEREPTCERIVRELGWQGPVYRISAINKGGTEGLSNALMDRLEDIRNQLGADERLREQEAEDQVQMEFEVRKSIERARQVWREKNKSTPGRDGDDD